MYYLTAFMILLSGVAGAGNQLSVSSSGHYIQYSGKARMLVGDSGTQCVMQNLNLNYRQWVDDCAQRGITAVHIWALVPPRQKSDGSVIEARYGYVYPGATPWARRDGAPPGTDGWPQWDLTRFDEGDDPNKHYWPRLRDLCSYAKQRDIIVGITVFFGWPKHNSESRPDWSYHPFNVANGGFLTDSKTITTVTQTIHSPGVEVLDEAWSEHWPPEKKTQWVWERYADKLIRETISYGNVFYVFMDEHSYPEGNCGDHFLAFFKKRGAIYTDWDRRRGDVDFVHDDARNPEGNGNPGAVAAFIKTPVRPNIALEAPPYQGDVVRLSIWSRLMGGLHFLFHNDSAQEDVKTGIMVYDPNVQGGYKEKVLERLDWLGHASRFFNNTISDLDSMVPHNELISSAEDTYCLANPGFEYAVYSWIGKSFGLDLSAAAGKAMVVRFYNPRNGQWTEPARVKADGIEEFEKPDDKDWVFYAISISDS
jgi:hypothetical protein